MFQVLKKQGIDFVPCRFLRAATTRRVLIIFRVVRPSKTGAQPKVGEFDVAISINKNIVRFDIQMNEPHFVNRFHSSSKLCKFATIIQH